VLISFVSSIDRKRWKKIEATGNKPKGRHFHTAIIHASKMFVFGGKSNGYMNDLFYLDLGMFHAFWVEKVVGRDRLASQKR